MSIFSKISNAIFVAPAVASPMPGAPRGAADARSAQRAPTISTGTQPSGAPMNVDIAPILDAAVAKSGQKLNWKQSIVDLMKALGLDSGLPARKELARELRYPGDLNNSVTMNMWLHRAVMKKLAENGGKVPSDLAD